MPTEAEVLGAVLAGGPAKGTTWRHSKTGRKYMVLFCAIAEKDLAAVVVYKSLENNVTWVRPYSEWFDTVSLSDGDVPRFVPED